MKSVNVADDYPNWPRVMDLCRPESHSTGLQESRGGALIDISKKNLVSRMKAYCDPDVSWQDLEKKGNKMTRSSSRNKPRQTREKVLEREPFCDDNVVEFAEHTLDVRWAYYSGVRSVWKECRPRLRKQSLGNDKFFITHASASYSGPLGRPSSFSQIIGSGYILSDQTEFFPFHCYAPATEDTPESKTANLSDLAREWIDDLGLPDPDTDENVAALPWYHLLAVSHSPDYIAQNGDMLRIDWIRVPLPACSEVLKASAALGMEIASLLNPKAPLKIPADLRKIGLVHGDNPRLTGGWASISEKGRVSPTTKKIESRDWKSSELKALRGVFRSMGIEEERGLELLGKAVDVVLDKDETTRWKGVPEAVAEYRVGAHRVIRKWLSYRDDAVIKRTLDPKTEVAHFTEMVWRIAVLILMDDRLNANYAACRDAAWTWPDEGDS